MVTIIEPQFEPPETDSSLFIRDFIGPFPDLVSITSGLTGNGMGICNGVLVVDPDLCGVSSRPSEPVTGRGSRVFHEIGHLLTISPRRWYRWIDGHPAIPIDFRFNKATTEAGVLQVCTNEIRATAVEMALCERYGYRPPSIDTFIQLCRSHIITSYAHLAQVCPTSDHLYTVYLSFMQRKVPLPEFSAARTKTGLDFVWEWHDLMHRLVDMRHPVKKMEQEIV